MSKMHSFKGFTAQCCVMVVFVLLLTGCGAEILMTTAARSELEARQAKSAVKQLDYVKGTVGNINIERAIQTYLAEHGVNPPSLEALVPKYLPQVPKKSDGSDYRYDPISGKLTDGPISTAPTAADIHKMETIRLAINQYGAATGYYPPTLDDLYPNYLPQAPRTASGQQFIYNNQNGYLAHPGARSEGQGVRSAGHGAVGEIMTGIGIQQQLGNMNTSGASAAQTHSRGDINRISDSHTNQQNRIMDQLGL